MEQLRDYRVKENIVHISMALGKLLQENLINDVDSGTLTTAVIELAEVYEREIAPNLEDGTYLEDIDIFAQVELLKSFSDVAAFVVSSMHHCNDDTTTFYFYVDESQVENAILSNEQQQYVRNYLLSQGVQPNLQNATLKGSLLSLTTQKEVVRSNLKTCNDEERTNSSVVNNPFMVSEKEIPSRITIDLGSMDKHLFSRLLSLYGIPVEHAGDTYSFLFKKGLKRVYNEVFPDDKVY